MMVATSERPTLLLVEDQTARRNQLQDRLRRSPLNFNVRAPESLDKTLDQLLRERSDGGMFDVRLNEWGVGTDHPFKVNGQKIRTGLDVMSLHHKINQWAPVCVSSSFIEEPDVKAQIDRLPFDVERIDMSTTSLPQIDARLRPIKRKMVQAKQRHPLAELTCESFDSLSDKEVFRRYKVALKTDENRIDFMIKIWGSFSWVAFQGDKAFWVGDGQNVKKVEQVEIKRAYPTQSQIQTAAKKSSKPIFMFWNTKPEMIKKIFQLDQTQLPSIMRTYFGLSLAGPLANMYLSGDEKTALGFAENLNPVGKLEFSKNVFKQLAGKSNRSHKKFARTFAEAKLPVVVEVFKSAVMEFEGRDTAWVSLEKWEGGSTLTEPFNLNTLRRSGVKYEHQLFEYTVYEDVLPVVGTDIDPVVAQEASLPTSAFQ